MEPAVRDATEKYEVGLFWPVALLDEVQAAATRTDRSLSSIVQLAWKTAGAEVSGAAAGSLGPLDPAAAAGGNRKQTIFLPGAMLDQLEAAAAHHDLSMSRVVHHAIVRARPALAALPSATGLAPD